jgi:hypothetical protein
VMKSLGTSGSATRRGFFLQSGRHFGGNLFGTSPMDLGISHNGMYTRQKQLYERHSLHP